MEQRLVDESIRKEREILEARLQAEEEQRSLIGNELHDSMGQKLGYIDLLLNIQKEQVETDQNLLAKIHTTVKTTIEEMRKLSRLLAPPSISNLGLREAVIELIESYSTFKRPKFHLEIYPTKLESKLQHDKKIMIYRVMQELINNSMKYGNPEQIKLNLQFVENKLIFLYHDDGIGFDAAKTVKGTGLKSIESRLNVYHGKMEIISSKGKGFKANLIIPTDK
jgi:signal transduction histidine kinase